VEFCTQIPFLLFTIFALWINLGVLNEYGEGGKSICLSIYTSVVLTGLLLIIYRRRTYRTLWAGTICTCDGKGNTFVLIFSPVSSRYYCRDWIRNVSL